MKDYYAILEVKQDANAEAIRKAYRKKAFMHHPDRNQDDPEATERFKDVAEAYGVLIDPQKRREYDQFVGDGSRTNFQGEFKYSQEEIFRDLFSNPATSRIFHELLKEFAKAGLRSDKLFLGKLLFGGRGLFVGGIFFVGFLGLKGLIHSMGQPSKEHIDSGNNAQRQFKPMGVMQKIGQKVSDLLGMGSVVTENNDEPGATTEPYDITYHLSLAKEQLQKGTWVLVALDGESKVKVRIPPGTLPETTLRLKGKGMAKGSMHGDLYLVVHNSPL